MAIKDHAVHKDAKFALDRIVVPVITATGLTDAVIYEYQPSHAYQLVEVRSYCRTKAGTVTAAVKVGSATAVTTVTFTAATDVEQTVSTTLANVRGSDTEPIKIELTTDGSGALTNGSVTLVYRAAPLNGEVHSV